MSNKKKQWKTWLKDLRSKGYSKANIKRELRSQGYSDKEISRVLKLESTDQKRTIYTIILICIIAAGALLWISSFQKTTPETIKTTQSIFTEIGFAGITTDTITEEERTELLNDLEDSFNQQCSDTDSVPLDTCHPFVIYSYVLARKQLGIPLYQVHTELSSTGIDIWKDYYKDVEFDKEGLIIGKDPAVYNSIIQYYYLISLLPEPEKVSWFEKIIGTSPTRIVRRFYLVRIYSDYFKVLKLSQIPEEEITQEEIQNLCQNLSTKEGWGVCDFSNYFVTKNFCEIEITDDEVNIAKPKLETATQDSALQVCRDELQKRIS